MSHQEKPVPSPCVGVCSLDEQDICIGCYRSAAEITHWSTQDNAGRREVLALSEARAKASGMRL